MVKPPQVSVDWIHSQILHELLSCDIVYVLIELMFLQTIAFYRSCWNDGVR
jgi:hypothetical protein